MSNDLQQVLGEFSREFITGIWDAAKVDVHSLDEDDQLMALIMLDHVEYKEFWEDYEKYKDYKFDPENEVDPYLHVMMHHLVEKQIRIEDPREVTMVYQALLNNGKERNEAIHLIGAIFLELLLEVLTENKSFDTQRYLEELIKLPMQV